MKLMKLSSDEYVDIHRIFGIESVYQADELEDSEYTLLLEGNHTLNINGLDFKKIKSLLEVKGGKV